MASSTPSSGLPDSGTAVSTCQCSRIRIFRFFFQISKKHDFTFFGNDSEKTSKVGSKNFVLNDANIVTKKKKKLC